MWADTLSGDPTAQYSKGHQMLMSEVIVIPCSGKLKDSDNLRVCGYNGRPVIFRADEFPPGSLVYHIPQDVFAYGVEWLEDPLVRVRYYFGKPSYGFFMAAPEGKQIGDIVEWSGKHYGQSTVTFRVAPPSFGFIADVINYVWSHFSVLHSEG